MNDKDLRKLTSQLTKASKKLKSSFYKPMSVNLNELFSKLPMKFSYDEAYNIFLYEEEKLRIELEKKYPSERRPEHINYVRVKIYNQHNSYIDWLEEIRVTEEMTLDTIVDYINLVLEYYKALMKSRADKKKETLANEISGSYITNKLNQELQEDYPGLKITHEPYDNKFTVYIYDVRKIWFRIKDITNEKEVEGIKAKIKETIKFLQTVPERGGFGLC